MRWLFGRRVSQEEADRRHQEIYDRMVADEREIRSRDARKWAINACLRSPSIAPAALYQTADEVAAYVQTGEHPKWTRAA